MPLTPPVVKLSDELRDAKSVGKGWQKKQVAVSNDVALLWGLLKTVRRFSWLDGLLRKLGTTPKQCREQLEMLQAQGKLLPPEEAEADLLHVAVAHCQASEQPWLSVADLVETLAHQTPPHLKPLISFWQLTPERYEAAKTALHKQRWKRRFFFGTKEALEVVGLMLVFLIVMREWIGEPRLIPSESMLPTLKVDDRVFIEKVSQWWRPYQRGDVMVFYPPSSVVRQDPWSWFLRTTGISGFIYEKDDHVDVAYIKRLIGLPGDIVEVKPGVGVYVNGKLLREPYKAETSLTCTQELPTFHCGPLRVPAGHYFLLGDNRNASQDSRYWGFLPKERIIGRAAFIMWPPWHWQSVGHQPEPFLATK